MLPSKIIGDAVKAPYSITAPYYGLVHDVFLSCALLFPFTVSKQTKKNCKRKYTVTFSRGKVFLLSLPETGKPLYHTDVIMCYQRLVTYYVY